MKIYKRTILSMIVVCILSLCLSLMFELKIINVKYFSSASHFDFYKNILMGIFTSGLLVLIPAIVGFFHERKQYYLQIYQTGNTLLITSLEILKLIERNSQEKLKLEKLFNNFSISYTELITCYSNFTYFIFFTKKDKLIESIVIEVKRYSLFIELLFDKSQELSDGVINEQEYRIWFEKLRKEMIDTYGVEFPKYRKMLNQQIASMIEDRKLKKYY